MNLTNLISNTDFFEGEIISLNPSEKQIGDIEGKGKAAMLIIIFRKEEEQIPFLEKIFSAIKLNLEKDMYLLKLEHDTQFQLMDLQKEIPFKEVIFFGYNPKLCGLNLEWKRYKLINWNGLKMMSADGLDSLSGNENQKRALWNSLKDWNGNT